MKRKLSKPMIAVATAMVLVVAACGSDDDGATASTSGESETADTTADTTAEETVTTDAASTDTTGSDGDTASGTPEWCGDEDIVLGYSDGNGGNGWRKVTLTLLKDAVEMCPNITEAIYLDARGSAQTQISQMDSLIAQGANVIVSMPDAGAPLVPVFRKAMEAGIKVVPFTQPPEGGEAGTDFVAAVVADNVLLGEFWGDWMCETLDGEGNVIFMGGIPGNSQSLDELEGIETAFAKEGCEGMVILDPAPVTTNWQVAMYQQAMTGLIAQYDQIDGIIVDYGGGFVGAVTAFENAGLQVPPVATNGDNQLACLLMEQDTAFIMYTSGNKQVVNALQQGIAALNDVEPPEAALYPQAIVFDTEGDEEAICDPTLPAGAALGEGLSVEQLQEILEG